jgi:hypothetical protein
MRSILKYCLVILYLQINLLAKGQDYSFIWKMDTSLDPEGLLISVHLAIFRVTRQVNALKRQQLIKVDVIAHTIK